MESLEDILLQHCTQKPTFGEVLAELRDSRNLTQRELGKLLSFGEVAVSKLINRPMPLWMNFTEIRRIGRILNLSEEERVRFTNAFICELLNSRDLI